MHQGLSVWYVYKRLELSRTLFGYITLQNPMQQSLLAPV